MNGNYFRILVRDTFVSVSHQFVHGCWSSFVNASKPRTTMRIHEQTRTSRDIYVTLRLYNSSRMNAFPKYNPMVHQRRQCAIRLWVPRWTEDVERKWTSEDADIMQSNTSESLSSIKVDRNIVLCNYLSGSSFFILCKKVLYSINSIDTVLNMFVNSWLFEKFDASKE